MNIKGIRFCLVADEAELIAEQLIDKAGFVTEGLGVEPNGFSGAIFPAGDSRIEIWPSSDQMKAVTMLQVLVDDANAWAEAARDAGATIQGPFSAHGECIYSLKLPGDLVVSVQSEEKPGVR